MTDPEKTLDLTLDAGTGAFGSGEHPSTQGALIALNHLAEWKTPVRSVLDIGCGSAILAMASALHWPGCAVLAADIEVQAVETARRNIARNALRDRIRVLRAAGCAHRDIAAGAPYDLILCNIVASTVFAMAHEIQPLTRPGTYIVLSGVLVWRAGEVLEAYKQCGCVLQEMLAIEDWRTLMLKTG